MDIKNSAEVVFNVHYIVVFKNYNVMDIKDHLCWISAWGSRGMGTLEMLIHFCSSHNAIVLDLHIG